MKGSFTFLAIWLYLTAIYVSSRKSDSGIWYWQCNTDEETCTRISSTVSRNTDTYPTLETCRLVCGKYGALWPQPTSVTKISSTLLKFPYRSIKFNIPDEKNEVNDFLREISWIFLETVANENTTNCPEQKNTVTVTFTVQSDDTTLNWGTNESYNLDLTTTGNQIGVQISAPTIFGARHGLETLSQLMDVYPNNDGTKCLVVTDEASISDAPFFPHRGLLLDTARNFLTVSKIKKHIDGMAASKLNVLHWHITDSQSFPLELPQLPNMTKFGAYSSDKIYHPEDITNLLGYAKLRGVRIIIEIDAPSHAGNGWQWGPDAGLGNLSVCIDQQPWRSYCIQPPCGQLNPINPNVFDVLKLLYNDIVNMLPKGEIFHMGGDEVYIPCWNATPEIITYLEKNGKPRTTDTFLDLWSDYQNKSLAAFDFVARNSDTPIILWTSHLTQADVIEKYLSKARYVIQTWVPASDNLPTLLLELGYRIIVSTKDAWYLDHGFWGTTEYHNWRVVYNNKIPTGDGALGGEVCMWGEYVDDSSVESRVWPRAAAAAERLWTNPSDYVKQTERRFYRHRERLVARGIHAEALVPRWCYQNEGECW
ncbi:beta-N-acetylglucosaminidase NAG2 isoform X2 [Tribolium castaneum]|uniref:beta-N-acetylglucosaminidase NAG2 isoform X2 n=1 Tax=Tribolium castaneum TaxID=7070 RepID=UPI00046C2DD5|nr:PREDICTED: beta-N-acetylglucosaminidase NAG2 isoform X2 [Tribolium castaneum]|eukprot:XP_008200272.1 PREDICTED: beta-N-acetylglucosaminidase NAG2 isoform X2 [Tribolium castaneum]